MFIRISPNLVVLDPGIIAKWIWLAIASKGNGSIGVVLSAVDIVVAFVCASSNDVRIVLACVWMSVMKLTKVGLVMMGWDVWHMLVMSVDCLCLVMIVGVAVCRARFVADCRALPLTLAVPVGGLLILTLLSWLSVSSSSCCSGAWM